MVLLVIFLITSISISSVFIYFHCYLKKSYTYVNTSANTNIKTVALIYETNKWQVLKK